MYARDFGLELNLVVDRDPEQRLVLHRGRHGSYNGGAARHHTGGRSLQDRGRSCGCGGILSLAGLPGQSNERLAGCHPVSLSDQHFGHPKPGSVERHDGLLARHQEAGDTNGRRETGLRGAHHAYLHGARRACLRCEERCGGLASRMIPPTRVALAARPCPKSHGRCPDVRPMPALDCITATHEGHEIHSPNIARRNHTGSGPSNADISRRCRMRRRAARAAGTAR